MIIIHFTDETIVLGKVQKQSTYQILWFRERGFNTGNEIQELEELKNQME